MSQKPIKVLMVCAGNICRSPMAEGVFRKMVADAGLSDKIMVDSAGTGAWHVGEPAHRGTLDVLKRSGILYEGRSRQITRDDLDDFDYVLAMDRENLSYILRAARGASAEIRLFLSYANEAGRIEQTEVSDPYYDESFDQVYDLICEGSAALLAHIRRAHNL
jgi:protein-tyrosine phosphatase